MEPTIPDGIQYQDGDDFWAYADGVEVLATTTQAALTRIDSRQTDANDSLETKLRGEFTAADAGLQSQIDSARADADSGDDALLAAIQKNRNDFETEDASLRARIVSGDAALQSQIQDAREVAAAADTALDGRVDVLESEKFPRRVIPIAQNLDVMRGPEWAGPWEIPSTTWSQNLQGKLPEQMTTWYPGQLIVYASGSTPRLTTQMYLPYAGNNANPPRMWVRSTGNIAAASDAQSWTPWRDALSGGRGIIPIAQNIDVMRDELWTGPWYIPSTTWSQNLTGTLPPGETSWKPGTIQVWASGSTPRLATQFYLPYAGATTNPQQVWTRTTGNIGAATDAASWTPWVNLIPVAPPPAQPRPSATKTEVAARRRGGVIGTDKPVVALRFDHGITPFVTKVLPLLQERDIPASQCHFVTELSREDDKSTGHTWDEIQAYSLQNGIEFWNHGRTHYDADTDAEMIDELVQTQTDFTNLVPLLAVDGFMVPGVTGTRFQGWSNVLGEPEKWENYYAGNAVLSAHGMVSGGTIQYLPLAGRLPPGFGHITIDTSTTSVNPIAYIGRAIRDRAGLILMMHPSQLDETGQITTPVLIEILDELAARRDAGELEVMTVGGLVHADLSTTYRHSLTPDWGSWAKTGFTGSTGSTGAIASFSTTTSSLSAFGGSGREFRVPVTTAGTIRLEITHGTDLTLAKTFQLTAGQTARVPFLLPTSRSGYFTAKITITAGPVTIDNPRVIAI